MDDQEKDQEKVGNPEIFASEVSEKVTGDAPSSKSQVSSSSPVKNSMEKENNIETGLPEEDETREVRIGRPSGSTLETLEIIETRENLVVKGVKEIVSGKGTGETGEKRSIESDGDSTLEPNLKSPRLDASYGDPNCDIERKTEISNQSSTEIGIPDSRIENHTESGNDVTRMKSWDHDSIMQLISAVKGHPVLYNESSIFCNDLAWCSIGYKLKRTDCRLMFTSLREKFKIAHLAMSDPKSDKNLQKDFPYYDELLFLKPYVIHESPRESIFYSQRSENNYKWPVSHSTQSQTPTWLKSQDENQNKPATANIFREKLLELEKERDAQKEAEGEKDNKLNDAHDEEEKPEEVQADPETPTRSGDKISDDSALSVDVLKTQDFFIQLIKAIKDNPCIYNQKHPYFRNFYLKAQIWTSIATKLDKSLVECLSTYNFLANRFVETHAMLKNQKLERPGFLSMRFPYYDDMLFLENHVNLAEVRDSMEKIISMFNPGHQLQNRIYREPYNLRSQSIVVRTSRRNRKKRKNAQKGVVEPSKDTWQRFTDKNLVLPLNNCDLGQGSSQHIYPGCSSTKEPLRNWNLPQEIHDLESDSQTNKSKSDDKVIVIENSDDAESSEFPIEEDINVQVVRAVKGHPCIYDQSNVDFAKDENILQAWTDISEKLKTGREECQMLYKSLYEKFVQTFAMLQDPNLVKQGFSKKSFKYYDEMIFLENQMDIAELQVHVNNIKKTHERETKGDAGAENQQQNFTPMQQNLDNTVENVSSIGTEVMLKMKPASFLFRQAGENKDQDVLPSSKTEQPAADSHVDFYFKSLCQQVKRADLSDRDFVQLQIAIMTALSNILSQQRN